MKTASMCISKVSKFTLCLKTCEDNIGYTQPKVKVMGLKDDMVTSSACDWK